METKATEKKFNVGFKNITDETGVLSVAGPLSRNLMAKLTDVNVDNEAWPAMTKQDIMMAGVPVFALRLSYTGQD